jgi:hypothetical protein
MLVFSARRRSAPRLNTCSEGRASRDTVQFLSGPASSTGNTIENESVPECPIISTGCQQVCQLTRLLQARGP